MGCLRRDTHSDRLMAQEGKKNQTPNPQKKWENKPNLAIAVHQDLMDANTVVRLLQT